MKYTQNEILKIKNYVSTFNIPIDFEYTTLEKITLRYKYEREIFLEFTNLFCYSFTGKHSNGSYYSFSHQSFDQILYALKHWLTKIKSDNPHYQVKESIIENFSSNFYNVFQEAIIINSMNFKESAGMIYRKSLEILIKDFLLKFLPSYEEIILEETVGGIVFFFYEIDNNNNNLKVRSSRKFKKKNYNLTIIKNELDEVLPLFNFVNNTFKIGNDFSHYERRLNNYTTSDLEQNIYQIIDCITIRYQVIEAQRKLMSLDNNFRNHSL